MNAATLLSASAERRPERAAWIYGAASASYLATADRVARLAGGLRRSGLGPGDSLVLVLPNGPALFELLWACFWAGIVAAPVNRQLHPREVAFVAGHSGARAVAVSEPTRAAAGELEPPIRVVSTESPGYQQLVAATA
jgi:acyl-CoA synthetase (AMP-forming)/AMP-acid ligase II